MSCQGGDGHLPREETYMQSRWDFLTALHTAGHRTVFSCPGIPAVSQPPGHG